MSVIDRVDQYAGGDTITREEYRRANGIQPAVLCLECKAALTPVQVKRGGKFCSSRCGGTWNARIPAKPKPEAPQASDGPASEPPALELEIELDGNSTNGHRAEPDGQDHVSALIGLALASADKWSFMALVGDIEIQVRRCDR